MNRTEQKLSKLGTGPVDAAEAHDIGVHATKVPRRLVLLGVTYGAKRPMGLDNDCAKCRAGESESRCSKDSPGRVVTVSRSGGRVKRQPDTVQANQAIGELVLHRLELADELAE